MKAYNLFHEILSKGLDNSSVMEYKHSYSSTIQESFEEGTITGKSLEDGEELLAVWGDKEGNSLIGGIADTILTKNDNSKIYFYSIE